jgi:hypothetical protein
MTSSADEESLLGLQHVWHSCANAVGAKDPNTQWLIGGVNVRVNALQALKAVYLSAKLYLQGSLALTTGSVGPIEIAKLGKNLFDLVVTTLNALRERLPKSTYAACVVLAGSQGGLTTAELERELKAFVESANSSKLPFYMGFTSDFLSDLRKELESPDAIGVIVDDLRRDQWILVEEDGRMTFRERHFVWGVSSS